MCVEREGFLFCLVCFQAYSRRRCFRSWDNFTASWRRDQKHCSCTAC